MNFPNDFIWGVASSSYQIEGAHNVDGKGVSIWDTFSHTPDKIAHNSNGDISCNHYELFHEDIAIMKQLGIKNYRFSISWPRIFPNGDSIINLKGLAFYDNLVNELLKNGITPYITLYHWDLPQALENEGGWLNRKTSDAFAYYAGIVTAHFSDRVHYFTTFNEPQCIAGLGYGNGLHAPGHQLGTKEVLTVFHHLAIAHGKAVRTMRSLAKEPIQIGIVCTGNLCFPSEEISEDIELARELTYLVPNENWAFSHTLFCDAIILGKYPDISHLLPVDEMDYIKSGDLELASPPIDYYGVNVYNGHEVSSKEKDYFVSKYDGFPRTALKWPVTPEVMNYGMRFLYERYQLPIHISENGLSCNDKIFLDGKVHDLDRIDFLQRYLQELEKTVAAGCPVKAFFHWCFTDNFEWHSGYSERFGIVFVDYPSQKRIVKDSGYWYSEFINC